MIISKTPFRISFFGGGTDYPAWYMKHCGAVLSTTINKYCYITCRYLPPFFKHKYRIVHSRIENINNVNEIEHPAVRGVLQFLNIKEGLAIHHEGDLPARSGIGSSSSFTVGLLHSLYALKELMPTKMKLAKESIHIEQDILKENVGSQDQVEVAYGGLNKISFNTDGEFQVEPIILNKERLQLFQDHLLFYFTGFSRNASEIAKEQIKNTENKKKELNIMHQMVQEGVQILTGNSDITEFGKLLNESWKLKRSLTNKISTPDIDNLYEIAMRSGAVGGKLLGAGGGGFILFFASPSAHKKIKEKLKNILNVSFKFENYGSQIVFYA
ncbi:MAG: kinase [Candidatus Firestonebacteria bacterium]